MDRRPSHYTASFHAPRRVGWSRAAATRGGFVGAGLSEWTGIPNAVKGVVEMGKGVGLSSLRALRLDEEFVELLTRGGYCTMTIAADAPSQRLRDKMAKDVRTKHLREAALPACRFGTIKLKMYVIVGLPDEGIEFSGELAGILPLAHGVSPLVPKLHTPLGKAAYTWNGKTGLSRWIDAHMCVLPHKRA